MRPYPGYRGRSIEQLFDLGDAFGIRGIGVGEQVRQVKKLARQAGEGDRQRPAPVTT